MRLSPKLLLLVSCLLLAASALALDVKARGNTVLVNGMPVIQLLSSDGGISPATRAEIVVATLDGLEEDAKIEVKESFGTWVISAGDSSIVSVTEREAKLHKTTASALAKAWASNLRDAIHVAPIRLSSKRLALPLGETRGVGIYGPKWDNAQIESTNENVATFERVSDGVKVTGKAPGIAAIVVSTGDTSEHFDVVVRPWAASLPPVVDAEVIGAPAAGTAVRGAISYSVHTLVPRLPTASLSFDVPRVGALGAGGVKSFAVRVRATAPEAFESVGYVKVRVRNVPIVKQQDSELWYCNDPEIVKKAQNLFAAELKQGAPARLLYHHVNGSGVPLFIRIQVVNDSDEPAKVVFLPGDSNPSANPVKAGVQAADQYMRSWLTGSAEVLTVPARSAVPVSIRRLSPNETMSGLCSLRLLDGPGKLLVRTDSWPPFSLDSRWRDAVRSSTPWRYVGANPINSFDQTPYVESVHIFPNPYKEEEVSYEVGGRYGFVRIGQKPIARPELGLNLDGNFGVIYSIKASMQNPTAVATDVEVVFEASAGYSAGLFLVNGLVTQTPLLNPKQEARIAKVHLGPGASRSMNITTVPLSGSSYPATITVRPVQIVTLEQLSDRKN